MNLKEFINENIKVHWKNTISRILKWKDNIKYFKELIEQTKFLAENSKVSERIYCYLNNIISIPLCKE